MYLSLDILKSILMFITFSTLVHLQDQLRRRHGLMVVGFRVQFPAMLYTCVSLDILKSTLGSRLPGSIPGHAYVYNFFNAFVHLQDQLYIIYIGSHRGWWFNLNKTCDQIPIAALKTPQPMSHSIFLTSTTATWTATLHLLFCGTCLVSSHKITSR